MTASVRPRRLWRLLEWLLVALIGYLATTPSPPRTIDLGWDKANHAAAFAALTVVGLIAYGKTAWGQVVVALLGFGAAIEIVQSQVPGRSSEWADLLADSIGIAVGLGIARILVLLQSRQAGRQ